MRPDFSHELSHGGIVAGVDEAGRGPLAGPVVAAAVVLDARAHPGGVDDSKKLTEARREALFAEICATAIFGVGEASPEEIDRLNILWATMLAMERAVAALTLRPRCRARRRQSRAALEPQVRDDCRRRRQVPVDRRRVDCRQGDARPPDAPARRVHPHYGWADNKGYSTPGHVEAVMRVGVTIHHRRSFAPVQLRLRLG